MLWERYERKLGLLPMTKPFVQYAINKMSDEEITHLAQEVEKDQVAGIVTTTNITKAFSEIDLHAEFLKNYKKTY